MAEFRFEDASHYLGFPSHVGSVDDTPQFPHDCDRCVFLGRHKHAQTQGGIQYNGQPSVDVDLYYCPTDLLGSTIIARYGKEGAYTSGLVFGLREKHVLHEALLRALKKSPEIRHRVLSDLIRWKRNDESREAIVKLIEKLIDKE